MVAGTVLKTRPLFFPALFLWVGALCATWLPISLHFGYALLIGLLGAALSIYRQRRIGAHLLLLVSCGVAGASLARWQEGRPSSFPHRVIIQGRVDEVAQFPYGTRLTLTVTSVNGELAQTRAQLHSESSALNLLAGQRVRVPVRWTKVQSPSNPGEADRARARERRGIHYTGHFDSTALVLERDASVSALWLESQHQSLKAKTIALAPTENSANLFLTLSAGLRAALGQQLEEEFSASGLAHLLSVSGLHVAALALIALAALRRLLVRLWRGERTFDVRRIAAPLAIPFVWAYVFYTGNQGPAVRSAFMTSALFFGLMLWRRSDGLNALALAAFVVVAIEPSTVGDLSMQLSFVAVLSLILGTPIVRSWFPERIPHENSNARYWLGRSQETILTTFSASIAVTLGSAPLVAGAFGRISVAGLISNVVCLPISAFLTFLAAMSAGLHVIHPNLATPLILLGTWTSSFVLDISHFFAHLPGAVWSSPFWSPILATVYWLGLLALVLGHGRWRWLGISAAFAFGLSFVPPKVFTQSQSTVTFLSVGQGDSIVVSSRGKHALIDGGGVPGGMDTGQRFVLPFLRHQGISTLELAVLSHPHPDHSLGMVSTLLEIPTRRLWLAASTEDGPLSEQLIRSGRLGSYADAPMISEAVEVGHPAFDLGEMTVEVLGPPKDRALIEGVNDKSIVLRVRHQNVSFLLTGDIEAAGEELLNVSPVTVVKAPHHGSRTSSGESFIERTRPKFVVFCVGKDNRFRFPHNEVVERYQTRGSKCFRTDLDGAIQFTSDGTDVEVTTFRRGAMTN